MLSPLPTPHSLLSLRALRVVYLHLNLAVLDLLLLRQRHAQHAVFELGVHRVYVDRRRQAERAGETAVAALNPAPVVAFLLLLELALAAQSESVVFNGKVEIARLQSWQVDFELD